MGTFGDFMIHQAVKRDKELERLRTSHQNLLKALEQVNEQLCGGMSSKEARELGAVVATAIRVAKEEKE